MESPEKYLRFQKAIRVLLCKKYSTISHGDAATNALKGY